jgi:hypothetical protein
VDPNISLTSSLSSLPPTQETHSVSGSEKEGIVSDSDNEHMLG